MTRHAGKPRSGPRRPHHPMAGNTAGGTMPVEDGVAPPTSARGIGGSGVARASLCLLAALLCRTGARAQSHTNVQTVFLLVMENVNWPTLKTNLGSAPYLVSTLLPMASSC